MTDLCASKGCGAYGCFCWEWPDGRLIRACATHREAAERAFVEAIEREKSK